MSEWAATYVRGNPTVDGVRVLVEHQDGTCKPLRRTLIAALPELRQLQHCPPSRTDLEFLAFEFIHNKQLRKTMKIKCFLLEYTDMTQP